MPSEATEPLNDSGTSRAEWSGGGLEIEPLNDSRDDERERGEDVCPACDWDGWQHAPLCPIGGARIAE